MRLAYGSRGYAASHSPARVVMRAHAQSPEAKFMARRQVASCPIWLPSSLDGNIEASPLGTPPVLKGSSQAAGNVDSSPSTFAT